MKLRICQNSIRIRLSGNDIKKLKASEEVVESLQFAASKTYRYILKLSGSDQVVLGQDSLLIAVDRTTFLEQDHVSIKWLSETGIEVLVESDIYG